MSSDVLIIGGGVIGLSTARELHKKGAGRITVVDKGTCGREASWAAAGMLGPQAEADKVDPFFELCSASRNLYPRLAEELLAETDVDIELDRTGTITLAFNDEDGAKLNARARWQRAAGLELETLFPEDLAKLEPYVSATAQFGLLFANDWQVENRKLVTALIRYADINGIEIIENVAVNSLVLEGNRVLGAETSKGPLHAATTVLTTGAWTSLIKLGSEELPLKVEPVRGQIIVLRPNERVFVHVMHTARGYIVPRADGRFLVGSTTEHVGFDGSVSEDAAVKLREAAREMSPSFTGAEIEDHWSGLRPYSGNGMPVTGKLAEIGGIIIATAHYRNGILLAPITAEIVSRSIVNGESSSLSDVFAPERLGGPAVGKSV